MTETDETNYNEKRRNVNIYVNKMYKISKVRIIISMVIIVSMYRFIMLFNAPDFFRYSSRHLIQITNGNSEIYMMYIL